MKVLSLILVVLMLCGLNTWFIGEETSGVPSYDNLGVDLDNAGRIVIGDVSALQIDTEITLMTSFEVDAVYSGGGRIIHKTNGSTGDIWCINVTGGQIDFRINNSYVKRGTINTATRYFVACTYDGSNRKWYIDDNAVETVATSGSITTTGEVCIGRHYDSTVRYFNGRIYFVAIWDKALTEAQIDAIYSAKTIASIYNTENSNLQLLMPLDDVADGVSGDSDTFRDISQNSLSGQAYASVDGEADSVWE